MNKAHVYSNKQIYHLLVNPLKFRLGRIKEKEDFFYCRNQ